MLTDVWLGDHRGGHQWRPGIKQRAAGAGTAAPAQAQTRRGPTQCITSSPIEITVITHSRGQHRDCPRRLQWGS
jgi:hypothetical protein